MLGFVLEDPIKESRSCEICEEEPVGSVSPAHMLVYLDPKDYEGVNCGPDEPCNKAICFEHAEAFIPWALH